MKIGIISINAHTKVLNFASVLHSYAFQFFLEQHGIESTIIDYKPVYYGDYDARHPLFSYIDHPEKDATRQAANLRMWRKLFYERENRFDKLERFYRTHYRLTDACYTAQSLDRKDPGFDCYLCVTDVIWKWNRGFGFDRGFFLACKCMEGKKKIAYAASRGGSRYTAEQEALLLPMVSDFDMISVRENDLRIYLSELTQRRIPQVVDPVFLNDRAFYESLETVPANAPSGPFVLIYVVMEETPELRRRALRFAAERGLEVIELINAEEEIEIPAGVRYRTVYDIGVEEWLWYMHNAEHIFTNSFHCCCFSAIYEKSFFAGERGGDKIPTVLSLLGLESRRVLSDSDLERALKTPIDPAALRERIARLRERSEEWILSALREVSEREHRPMLSQEEVAHILKKRKTHLSGEKIISRFGGMITNRKLKKAIKRMLRLN